MERSEPLHVYGPPRVRAYIEQSLRILDIYIDYEIVIHETFDSGLLVAGDATRFTPAACGTRSRVSATPW